jgi:hypothetical protein
MDRLRLLFALVLACGALAVWSIPAGAVNSPETCTFSKGETTCTSTQGSHGTESAHHGNTDSSGSVTLEEQSCKRTGSGQTNTC